ncbi:hypothetical protein ASG32_17795 [Methylobacterium sp. Leaf361]|uniref:hypothetical protein n=1 Tax=Methylobacterium sp. Leaf361 TaxID=1736352 RepID=UPI0006F591AC|nr:hypothetical protein [Methylobacterium sp. Leaf361]KQS85744.1 hypothetical protein ASG32_17795 [Methylobacterium sp. Leaf361]
MLVEFDPMLEAVEVLIALGHTITPDDDFERWQVDGGEWMSLSDLLALALRHGLVDGPGRAQ